MISDIKQKGMEYLLIRIYLTDAKKKTVKIDQFFSGEQYFSPTNNFTRLKLTPTKIFISFFFFLNKNQITEILKKIIRFIIP